MNGSSLISVVVPVYNEQGNLIKLHEAISKTIGELWYDCEIIFVDDGSQDLSRKLILQLCDDDPRVKYVGLSRNFGTQMAIYAGLEHARGAAVVVMDADLQHPPTLIREMVSRWEEGYEVVYSVRQVSQDVGHVKKLSSFAFARVFNALVDHKIDARACDFRLMDRKVVDQLVRMRERNRFFRCLVNWVGFRQIGVPYAVAKRYSGQTKWRFRKLMTLSVDAITSFSTVPLRICTFIGFAVAVAVSPYALWAVYQRLFTDDYVPGWPAIIVSILFLGAVQLISLGILGEYVGRIYEEVKGRPLYIARERHGFDNAAGHELSATPVKAQETD
jgi:dolichol-phosphate mannosyltransferase